MKQVSGAAASPMAAQQPPRRLRLLSLHSFRTSAAIFREQLQRAGLDRELEAMGADLTFVDAPSAASGPIPDDVAPLFPAPYYEWWNASRDEQGRWHYAGWQRAVEAIEETLRSQGPFDGLVGFSQGAAMASMAVAMQRSGCAFQGAPPLRFLLLFAGIRVRDPQLERFYEPLRPVPALHIIGDKDPVKRLTNMLIDTFEAPVVITHPRGHVIPQLPPPDLARLAAFLDEQRAAIAAAEREGGTIAGAAAASVAAAGSPCSRL